MKIRLLLIPFALIFQTSTSQVTLIKATHKSVDMVYHNDSSVVAYFSNPVFHTNQDKGSFWLRNDMYNYINDTLYLYLTDTTLSNKRFSKIYKLTDSLSRSNGYPTIDSLPPRHYLRYLINFPKTIKYKYLIIKYNFGYRRSDFINFTDIPVELIKFSL